MLPVGFTLPLASAILYTVPEGRTADIARIVLVNTAAAAVTVNLGVRLQAGQPLRPITAIDLSINSKDRVVLDLPLRLESFDTIEGAASVADVVQVLVSGEEKWSVWNES